MPLPDQLSSLVAKIQQKLPSRQDETPNLFMLAQVGSSAVKAALVRVEAEAAHILGAGEARQSEGAMLGGTIGNLDALIEKMDEAMTQATDTAGVSSDQLVLGLSGGMVGAMTTMVHLNRPTPKDKISDKELQVMLERIGQTALVDAEGAVSEEMGVDKEDLRLINSGITSINLDGYPLASPVGFSGKEVEFCLFNAFINAPTLVALQKILTDLNMDLAALSASEYALARLMVASAKKSSQANFLIINVGAGSTSVTLVEHGAVSGSKTFPLGGRAITAHLSHGLGCSLSEAEQIKIDYTQGKASEAQQHKIHPIVNQEAKWWLKGLLLALAEVQPEKALPEQIFITGNGSKMPDIRMALEKPDWYKEVGFHEAPKIEQLPRTDVAEVIDETHGGIAETMEIKALALFILRKRQEDKVVANAYQKTLRAMAD